MQIQRSALKIMHYGSSSYAPARGPFELQLWTPVESHKGQGAPRNVHRGPLDIYCLTTAHQIQIPSPELSNNCRKKLDCNELLVFIYYLNY